MSTAAALVIREFPMEVIMADTMEDLLSLFQQLIRFEDALVNLDIHKDPLAMAQTMDEILLMVDRCVLAYIDEEPVAFMMIDKGEPYTVGSLFVAEEHRSQGIGEMLVNMLREYHPNNELTVNCHKGNTRALSFYERLGFVFTESELIMKGVLAVD
jgi:GNAT superfamily N-acetyltransferase